MHTPIWHVTRGHDQILASRAQSLLPLQDSAALEKLLPHLAAGGNSSNGNGNGSGHGQVSAGLDLSAAGPCSLHRICRLLGYTGWCNRRLPLCAT